MASAFSGYRLDEVRITALFLQLAHQALTQELRQLRGEASCINGKRRQQLSPVLGGLLQHAEQIQAPAPAPENLQDAIASAAQGIGIR